MELFIFVVIGHPLILFGIFLKNILLFKIGLFGKEIKEEDVNETLRTILKISFFCTKTKDYKFNPIKMKKSVIAPYKLNGTNRDWFEEKGEKYRHTYVGNCLDNITISFWSMKENTEHPTQKPEKLIAKLILASSDEQDLVLDLFSGSGTTNVVSKKLNRKYIAIESDEKYCSIIEERLQEVNTNKRIQGFDGVAFLERNNV